MPINEGDKAYRTKDCKYFAKGAGECTKGDQCRFAHIDRQGVDHHVKYAGLQLLFEQDDEKSEVTRLIRKWPKEKDGAEQSADEFEDEDPYQYQTFGDDELPHMGVFEGCLTSFLKSLFCCLKRKKINLVFSFFVDFLVSKIVWKPCFKTLLYVVLGRPLFV